MLTSSIAVLATLAATALGQSSKTCYIDTNNDVQPALQNYFACDGTSTLSGGPELCCINGYECGPASICRTSDNGTYRYMIGGCTDKSYNDPVCNKHCSGDKMKFITYTGGKWHCCGNDGCDDGTPTDESFNALSPAQWTPISDDEGIVTSSPTNSPSSGSGSGGLSTGIIIAIVAGSLAVLVLIAVALLWWRSRRGGSKSKRSNYGGVKGRYEELGRMGRSGVESTPQPYGATQPYARDASPQPATRTREDSPEPYGRSLSPVPPVRAMASQRDRSRSPQPEDRLAAEEPSDSPHIGSSSYRDHDHE